MALERAAGYAAAAGRRDRRGGSPGSGRTCLLGPGPQRFDLVSAQFMHLAAAELAAMHRRLAAAVRPGGTLLVVAHHPDDLHVNVGRTGRADMFRSAEQVAASLDPASGRSRGVRHRPFG